jgi:hypothetical protein
MFRSRAKFREGLEKCHESLVTILVIVVIAYLTATVTGSAATQSRVFSSPEEAVRAFLAAVTAHDQKELLQVFGPEAAPILNSGDPISDREAGERLVKSYEEANRLEKEGDGKVIIHVGKDDWPFPIPLVRYNSGWRFDTNEGREEIINRRIGRNELDVIQVCLAYVDAQREYYQRNPQSDPLLQYAQKFVSTKGKRDGLYWEAKDNEAPSPLGPLAAQARAEGYKSGAGKPVPYHGYYYKILTRQGPNAPDGSYDYTVRGKMIGGFALVAYPAQYGNSGVMTFIVNHDGVVYQKDLGKNTASLAQAMTRFDPDKSWTTVK